MSRPKNILLILFSAGLLACGDIAPVVELNALQAGDVYPEIEMIRNINGETLQAQSRITVRMKDRDGKHVEILNGEIRVNGVKLSPPYALLNDTRPYYLSYTPVVSDSIYAFEIVFSDSSRFYAWIETPEIEFTSVNFDRRHPDRANMKVSWSPVDFRYPQYAIIQHFSAADGFTQKGQIVLNINYPFYGEFTIDGSHLRYSDNDPDRLDEHRIKIVAEETGVVDNRFHRGGYIQARIAIFNNLEIY